MMLYNHGSCGKFIEAQGYNVEQTLMHQYDHPPATGLKECALGRDSALIFGALK